MVFNPYESKETELVFANFAGLLYGTLKAGTLAFAGIALYEAPSPSLSAQLITSSLALACLAFGFAAAVTDKAAERRYEQMRRHNEANEQLAKANWIAMWTCYNLAAFLYGKPTCDLACQDMKILAIRITKIAAGIGAGLLMGWFASSTPVSWSWNSKTISGTSLLAQAWFFSPCF